MEDRRFFVTRLSAGFALAVHPIAAPTAIHTGTAGIEAGEVKVPVQGSELPAYRAMLQKGWKSPAVLVVRKIIGVHEHIKGLGRRFAQAGYRDAATEMYARQGGVSQLKTIAEIMPAVSKVPDAQVMADLDAAVAWAEASGRGDTSRLGLTGFCWGGRVAWLYAAHSAKLRASGAWYGRLVGNTDGLHPRNPIDVAANLQAPVLSLYGGKGQGIPQASIERMRAAIQTAGTTATLVVFPEAGHGFNAGYRPSYHKPVAEDGWKQMLAWFKKYGVT
jgi:carboxymethylenebutenolidase